MRRALIPVLTSTLALLVVDDAAAQSGPFSLRWSAPAGCPQQQDVKARIERLAGSKKANEGPFVAEGVITRTDDARFHLTLVVRAGTLVSQRNIESKSCDQLAGAAAVALGLLLQSAAPSSAEAKAPSPGAPLSSPFFVEASSASHEGPSDGTKGPVRVRLQVPFVALEVGPMP